MTPCEIPGCNAAVQADGACAAHRLREVLGLAWDASAAEVSAARARITQRATGPVVCRTHGCPHKPLRAGHCRACYARTLRTLPLQDARRAARGECCECGCKTTRREHEGSPHYLCSRCVQQLSAPARRTRGMR